MGMPVITAGTENRDQAITDLIESVALQETALAHILNAEGEKIQKAVAISKDINDLLDVNRSVNKTIVNVIQLEQSLFQKLDVANELYRTEQPYKSCHHEHSYHNPKPNKPNNPKDCYKSNPDKSYCHDNHQRFYREHYYINDITYRCETALSFSKTKQCYENSETVNSECIEIILKEGKYNIEFQLEFNRKRGCFNFADIEFLISNNEKIIKTIHFSEFINNSYGSIKGGLSFQLPNSCENYSCSLMLMSPCCVNVTGKVLVTRMDIV